MSDRQHRLRHIGIVHPEISGWMAGDRYVRTLAHSLSAACEAAGIQLSVLCEHSGSVCDRWHFPATIVPVPREHYYPGEWRLRSALGFQEKSAVIDVARERGISVLLPFRSMPFRPSGISIIGWIPDFQHMHHPEFFKPGDCRRRDQNFRRLAQRSTLTILSSNDAKKDFCCLFPDLAHKARVAAFPSLYAFVPPSGDPLATIRKFNLPAKYLLVANQFWRHKNHQLVIEAIHRVKSTAADVQAVMTGLPLDYRDPNNETTSKILQGIASAGIGGNVTVLGMLDDADFADLLRGAAAVVQPSLFEGWSTVIQDAKALGRPLICSDIPVHREQVPEALGFFACDRPDELAELLAEDWPRLTAGPDVGKERIALEAEKKFALHHGRSLLDNCREAVALRA